MSVYNNFKLDGPRWCSECRTSKPRAGGEFIKINNGRNQRWMCGDCCYNLDKNKVVSDKTGL